MLLLLTPRRRSSFLGAQSSALPPAVISFAAVPPAAGAGRARARGAQRSHAVTALIAVACVLSASAGAAQTIVPVSTEAQLRSAVATLASNTTIVLAPGTYTLSATLTVTGPLTDITIRGATGNRDEVVLVGPGMNVAADAWHGIQTVGAVTRLTVSDLSIKEVPGNCLYFGAGASAPTVRNVHLMNSGRSFLDMPDSLSGPGGGLVEYSLVEFVAPAIAKARSVAGVNIKGGANWIVRRNTFRRIWTNDTAPASAALLANFSSSGTLAENNTIVDCQSGISFGATDVAGRTEHYGGTIRNNTIYRSGQLESTGTGGGVSIFVADSPGTWVAHNTLLQGGTYPNAIEYRYAGSLNVTIRNNLVDKLIVSRDGATGTLSNNYTSATAAMFVNPSITNPTVDALDLHLVGTATPAMNAGASVVSNDGLQDFDGQARRIETVPDLGADEYAGVAPAITTSSPMVTGVVGVDYWETVTSSLYDPAWTFVAGQLPPGLEFYQPGMTDAVVTGTPTTVGTYRFRVRVIDVFDGSYAEKTFVLSVVSSASTVTSTVSQICGDAYSASPFPLYTRTFSYSIPAGYDIRGATISGTWGSSCYPNSTAGVDISLAGLLTARCLYLDAGCWIDQAAGLPPRPWSVPVSSSLFPQLATGSAALTAQQTSQTSVQLGATSLSISLIPRTVNVTVGTNVPGASFTVDGVAFTAPTMFSWVVDSTHTISTTTPQGTGVTRYAFSNWSDGGAINHVVTTPGAGATYTANFTTQYQLTGAVSPSGSGTVTTAPASADGFYNSGTVVEVTSAPAAGYAFANWSGSCAGTGACSVTMTAPRSVTANFTLLPPTVTGVSPSAGPLAGGTAITITGTNFLSGATVSVGGAAATSVVVVNATTITAVTRGTAGGGRRGVGHDRRWYRHADQRLHVRRGADDHRGESGQWPARRRDGDHDHRHGLPGGHDRVGGRSSRDERRRGECDDDHGGDAGTAGGGRRGVGHDRRWYRHADQRLHVRRGATIPG